MWWHELEEGLPDECPPTPVGAEHPLFILYTSGSTGKPKGVQHSSGGYLLGAVMSMKWVFDVKSNDIFWCTADVGWVTGHTYVTYGPLAMGATEIIFEGVPTYPDAGRFWRMIQDHKVSTFYTAPTAIRSLIKAGADLPKNYDLSSLRMLGTVGEPINPEAWMWYYNTVGQGRCPIVDTWWQTETGGHMISPLPGAMPIKPGSCTLPLPGIMAAIVDETGDEVELDKGGFLVIKKPWPSRSAPSGATRSASRRPIIRRTSAASTTWPATARTATWTAISGSWDASTTCSMCPATASARWRSSRRWFPIRWWRKPRWWAVRTI